MLADDHHAIHRQLASAQGKGIGHRGVEGQAAFLRSRRGEVAGRRLVDVYPCHIQPGLLPHTSPGVAQGETVEEMLGMGQGAHFGTDKSNFLPGILIRAGGIPQHHGGKSTS